MGRATLRLVALMAALLCVSGLTTSSVAAASTDTPGSFHYDLYRPGVFVTQYTWTWCVGASSQAMLNIIDGTSNTTRSRQKTLVKYAMAHDGFPYSNRGGS